MKFEVGMQREGRSFGTQSTWRCIASGSRAGRALGKQICTHGPNASFIDEKVYITPRQLPPRLVRALLV